MSKMNQVYGLGQPLIPSLPPPLKFSNTPTTNDTNYENGQIVYTPGPIATNFYIYAGGGVWALLAQIPGNLDTITTDDSTVVIPEAGNVNLKGVGSTTTIGSGANATVELTGLTNHNVLVGAGTTTITKVAPSATSGVPLISQGAAADPVFGTAVVAGGGTGATTLTSHGVLTGNGTSAIAATSEGATGTVLSGVTGAAPTFQAIPSLNIVDNTTGTVGSPTAMAVNTTYVADEASVITGFLLPASATLGQILSIIGNGPAGWQIKQNANQAIKMNGNTTTTGTGGSLSSTDRYNSVTLQCAVAGASTIWVVTSYSGVFTFV